MDKYRRLIAASVQNGHLKQALDSFSQMCTEQIQPDFSTISAALGACTTLKNLKQGTKLHSLIAASGCRLTNPIATMLIKMYGKCGGLQQAQEVFEQMPGKDLVCWTAMITAYAQNGHYKEALRLYHRLDSERLKPSAYTFSSVLEACASAGLLEQGRAVHDRILSCGLQGNPVVANSLMNMYAKCGSLVQAKQIFDSMKNRDSISWSTMIGGYAQQGHPAEAIDLYRAMSLKPTAATLVNALVATSSLLDLQQGRKIHRRAQEIGLEENPIVISALIDMYAKCGSLEEAEALFARRKLKNICVWTSILSAYTRHGQAVKALEIYEEMGLQNLELDAVAYVAVLNACASLKNLEQGRAIHRRIIGRKKMLQGNEFVGNSLINLYGKCGCLDEAARVFAEMKRKDVISWNTMISSLAQQGAGLQALALFNRMEIELKPNEITYDIVIEVCTERRDVQSGREIHRKLEEQGLLTDSIAASLVQMYARCGKIEEAQNLVHGKNPKTWSAMLAAYSQIGDSRRAMQIFHEMELEGVEADSVTFVSILAACSHAGWIREGYSYFASMARDHGIAALPEHYACIVDLLGRAGSIREAEALISQSPVEPDAETYMALLGACRIHNETELGLQIAEQVLRVNPAHHGAFSLAHNLFVAAAAPEEHDDPG